MLDLPTAVHRMTGMPAAKFRLADRGLVRPGALADLDSLEAAVGDIAGLREHPSIEVAAVAASPRSAGKSYADTLHEDLRLRRYIKERLQHSGVSRIEIERKADQIRIIIHTARPGIIIGKKGSEVEKLRAELGKMTKKEIRLDIEEVRKAAEGNRVRRQPQRQRHGREPRPRLEPASQARRSRRGSSAC